MMRRAVLLCLLVAGCSSAHVNTMAGGVTDTLPRPTAVVVTDFAITPDQVRLDSGVSAAFMRARNGQPRSALQLQAAQETQAALSETLVAKLDSYGLPAQRMAAEATPPPGSLLIQGQILKLDEGNRMRRTMVGLGAGRSTLSTDTQLYSVADPARPRFLRAFAGSADSGRMPGAVETMGAGAAADRIATSAATTAATHAGSEARRTGNQALADKVADALAHEIGTYAVSQGWIAASAVH